MTTGSEQPVVRLFHELVAGLLSPLRHVRRSVKAGLEEILRLSAPGRASWDEVASAAGLTPLSDPNGAVWGAGSLRVELSSYVHERVSGTRVRISGPTLAAHLALRPQPRVDAAGAREIEVGDPAFDGAAWVEGPPALVHSLLDAGTRRAMLGLLQGRLERPLRTPFAAEGRFEHGLLCVDVPDFPGDSVLSTNLLPRARPRVDASGQLCASGSAHLPQVLHLLLAVARRLEAPEDVPGRLVDNLRTEPLASVRVGCLMALAREYPYQAELREALLAAREDPDPEMRLRAGLGLEEEGRDVVLAVARDEDVPDDTSARAVEAIARHLSADDLAGLLRSALRTRRHASALACLRELGRRRERAVVPTLAKVLAMARPELAAAAAGALAATRDASVESALLAGLEAPDAVVRVAVAQALGRVGTAAAVAALRELEERDPSCRVAARQAVAEIQSRLAGAEPGQLSLAPGESGELSLAASESGQLSVAEGEQGRLSLAGSGDDGAPCGRATSGTRVAKG